APKFHDLIFEKFFRIGDPQLHSTGSTKFKGAGPGLGLPIAKGVIEAHGGRIWVESDGEDEDRLPGSRFHVILPLRPRVAEFEQELEKATRPAYLIG
ncbi:MAG: sensor histidine kinase, partial [Chloroflexi bacterium]